MEKMTTETLSKSYEEVNTKFKEYVKRVSELRVKDQFLNCPVRRVFISVPISGRGEGEIAADIEEAKNAFLNFFALNDGEEHFEFVSSFDLVQEEAPDNVMHEPLWYLGNSVKILSTCDIILFARGANRAAGCKIEQNIAESYNIPDIFIYKKREWRTSDFEYTDGHLFLFIDENEKDESKPKYMTEEGYKEWREEMDE